MERIHLYAAPPANRAFIDTRRARVAFSRTRACAEQSSGERLLRAVSPGHAIEKGSSGSGLAHEEYRNDPSPSVAGHQKRKLAVHIAP
jgi:hypothetical protein